MTHTSSAAAQFKHAQAQPLQLMPAISASAPAAQDRGGIGAMPNTLTSYDKMPVHDQYELALKKPTEFMRIVDSVPYRKDLVELNPSYKTQMCPSFHNPDFICRVGNACAYAMSLFEQVRYCTERHPLWRTKVCKHLRKGRACPFKACLAGHPGSLMRTFEKVVDLTTKKSWFRCTGFFILDHKAVKASNPEFPVKYINPPRVTVAQAYHPAGYAPTAPAYTGHAPQPFFPYFVQLPNFAAGYPPVAPSSAVQQQYGAAASQFVLGQAHQIAPFTQPSPLPQYVDPMQPPLTSHGTANSRPLEIQQQYSSLPPASVTVLATIKEEDRPSDSFPGVQPSQQQLVTSKITSPRPEKPEQASVLNQTSKGAARPADAPAQPASRPLGSLKKPGYALPPDVRAASQKLTKQLNEQKK